MLAVLVLAVAGTGLAVTHAPGPAPYALPKDTAAPAGPLDGTWRVAAGSAAGFRVRETVIGFSNDVTGRTSEVAGTAVVTGGQVAHAAFQVNLGSITVNGKARQPQLLQSLRVPAYPVATVALARPLPLPGAFSAGGRATWTTDATLTLNGATRPAKVTLSAARDGAAVDVAGSLPVAFADYGIKGPGGYGFLGSLASSGSAEFLLILRH